ncbi:MAG TPA: hypothetical protein DEF42_07540 [Desulfosporosinus sp.]|nr:hypothetical protein [Desulfosporosinus sp.]
MKLAVGFFLICVGLGIVWYAFKRYKEVYSAEKSWLKLLMFIIDVLGEGLGGLGLLLILVGLILIVIQVV